jgi:HAD superfamily phosphatase (TIGR01668 family)
LPALLGEWLMSIFYPTKTARGVMDITKEMLDGIGVTALILDVDNTLATHNNPNLDPKVREWLSNMRECGIGLVILSNNYKRRVRPFAEALKLPFSAFAAKPLPFGYARASRMLNTPKQNVAIVGDQIFTDVLGARLYGAKAILVEPLAPEGGPFFRFKRKIEAMILRRYREKMKLQGRQRKKKKKNTEDRS